MKLETAVALCSFVVVILRLTAPSLSKKWPRLAPLLQALLTIGPDLLGFMSRKCACESCLVPLTPGAVDQEARRLYESAGGGSSRPSFDSLGLQEQAGWKKAAESALLRHGMASPAPRPDPWTEAMGVFEKTVDSNLDEMKSGLKK